MASHTLDLIYTQFGAQLLQAKIADNDVLYNSSSNKIESNLPFRGGIQILFPQFGNVGNLKKHGFVRNVNWQIVKELINSEFAEIEFEYNINEDQYPDWKYSANLNLKIFAKSHFFRIVLQIKNIGKSSFHFTGGLHPYFKIKSRSVIKINGMEKCLFEDTFPVKKFNLNDDSMLERLYLNKNEITFFNGYTNLLIKSIGFSNWMFWNPGKEEAKNINDLPDEDWDKFICIEPVIKDIPVLLKPEEVFKGELHVELLNQAS